VCFGFKNGHGHPMGFIIDLTSCRSYSNLSYRNIANFKRAVDFIKESVKYNDSFVKDEWDLIAMAHTLNGGSK